ncbi:MAG: UDP-glucose 4-epimerase GalE [Patescibacteria group bacterium]|jgi:UDP-glucose 4-epimerase
MDKKILVLGGAGYIGSHVCKTLLKAGYSPIAFDNLDTGLKENIVAGVEFVEGDILNMDQLVKAMEGAQGVIYMAAHKAVEESMFNPEKYATNNICGAINVLNAMCQAGVKRIIFSSSSSIYGEPKYVPIDEDHPKSPMNFYGFTKLEMENLLKWYDQLKGIKFAALRYFNAVGYDPDGEIRGLERKPQNLLPVLMEAAIGKRAYVDVYGNDYDTSDGSCIRDYVHVTDLASAHLKALEKLIGGAESMALNLGTSLGISVLEMIEGVKKITGKDFEVRMAPRRAGDPAQLIASCEKAKEILGWSAEHSDLETIVQTTWNAYSGK